jgi:hypothetical protein
MIGKLEQQLLSRCPLLGHKIFDLLLSQFYLSTLPTREQKLTESQGLKKKEKRRER